MEPKRFELGEYARGFELRRPGTVAVRYAYPYGSGDYFKTSTPCCGREMRVSAWHYAGIGKFVTCPDCKWKWDVYLANPGGRLEQFGGYTPHPGIPCDRAEWVSRGTGARTYKRR